MSMQDTDASGRARQTPPSPATIDAAWLQDTNALVPRAFRPPYRITASPKSSDGYPVHNAEGYFVGHIYGNSTASLFVRVINAWADVSRALCVAWRERDEARTALDLAKVALQHMTAARDHVQEQMSGLRALYDPSLSPSRLAMLENGYKEKHAALTAEVMTTHALRAENFKLQQTVRQLSEQVTTNFLPRKTQAEKDGAWTRVSWAENLIRQLPVTHEGRNSWLLNFGVGFSASLSRQIKGLTWDTASRAASTLQGSPFAPHIVVEEAKLSGGARGGKVAEINDKVHHAINNIWDEAVTRSLKDLVSDEQPSLAQQQKVTAYETQDAARAATIDRRFRALHGRVCRLEQRSVRDLFPSCGY